MQNLQIIYEDNHLIAVNKPAGILVQADKSGDLPLSEMVKAYIGRKYKKTGNVFCGVIHRIDRPVSGLVILARTSKGLERMSQLFKAREVEKTYWALVKHKPEKEKDTLVHWLVKDKTKNQTKAYLSPKKGRLRSELSYELKARAGQHYLLEVRLLTGRSHQIRAQLAQIGLPIKGDVKYKSADKTRDGSICLHARKLSFIHPVRKELLSLTARLPPNQNWNSFAHLGF